ncbi:MAG: hypothetical protein KDD55_03600 [Bdellovibrionales bacterium]|nr:hypothetical protein [Bdellovibrionales bacterium]
MDPLSALLANKAIQGVTGALTRNSTTDTQDTESTSEGFDALLRQYITASDGENVSEEELFAAIVQERIESLKGTDAAEEFGSMLEANKADMTRGDGYVPVEDAVYKTLREAVESGMLTKEEKNTIRDHSFAAAQLDDNASALYDNRGGVGDPTIAVAEMEAALLSARGIIEQIEGGTLTTEAAPAAPDPVADTSTTSEGNKVISPNGTHIDGNDGFVFKPESDHEKKLVVLLPSNLANNVTDLVLKDEDGNTIEEGRSSGYANGGREHFRFNRAGKDYPENITVEVSLSDGSTISYEIPNPELRYD